MNLTDMKIDKTSGSPGASRRPRKDVSEAALLPQEQPLAMPEQNFGQRIALRSDPLRRGYWIPRAALCFGAALLTLAFGLDLHSAVALEQTTPLQLVFLVLATISFGWIAIGTLSAAIGFLPLFAGEQADTIDCTSSEGTLETRTALLFSGIPRGALPHRRYDFGDRG